MVRMSKVGTLAGVLRGVRQVLRATVASSFINVAKLCAGVPSGSMWLETLCCAAAERVAGATGSRVALAC